MSAAPKFTPDTVVKIELSTLPNGRVLFKTTFDPPIAIQAFTRRGKKAEAAIRCYGAAHDAIALWKRANDPPETPETPAAPTKVRFEAELPRQRKRAKAAP